MDIYVMVRYAVKFHVLENRICSGSQDFGRQARLCARLVFPNVYRAAVALWGLSCTVYPPASGGPSNGIICTFFHLSFPMAELRGSCHEWVCVCAEFRGRLRSEEASMAGGWNGTDWRGLAGLFLFFVVTRWTFFVWVFFV